MKKHIIILALLIFVSSLVPVTAGHSNDEVIPVYAADGRVEYIMSGDAEAYYKAGWYSEPVSTMYALDGRTLVVPDRDIPAYLNVGWYENPVILLYSEDGRQLIVNKADTEAYLAVGWYTEPVKRLYASDGRQCVVGVSQVDAYLAVWWYANIDDVSRIMVSPDGKEERVFASYYAYYFSLGYTIKNSRVIDPSKPMVALTYDDGPSIHTNRILDCLQLHGAAATFFEVGNNVVNYPQITKRAFDAGMEIGNHSYSHPNFNTMSVSAALNQIASTSVAISNATGGYVPRLMRPPYGNITKELCAKIEQPSIHWSIDTRDWATRNAWQTINSVLNSVKDGDIILMHDVYSQTAEATETIVPALIERGFQLVTVSELSLYKNQPLSPGVKYHSIR